MVRFTTRQQEVLAAHRDPLLAEGDEAALAVRVLDAPECSGGWYASGAITLAGAYLEKAQQADSADAQLTVAMVALRDVRAEWSRGGRDPQSGYIDWQRSVDRCERIAAKALDAIEQIAQARSLQRAEEE